jgi:hypothetical protein
MQHRIFQPQQQFDEYPGQQQRFSSLPVAHQPYMSSMDSYQQPSQRFNSNLQQQGHKPFGQSQFSSQSPYHSMQQQQQSRYSTMGSMPQQQSYKMNDMNHLNGGGHGSVMHNNLRGVSTLPQHFQHMHANNSSPSFYDIQQQRNYLNSQPSMTSMSPLIHNPMQDRMYQVQFKCLNKFFSLSPQAPSNITVGDLVIVEADRGEDLGVVTDIMTMAAFIERRVFFKFSEEDDNVIGRILRVAAPSDRQLLPDKFRDEEGVAQLCRDLAYSTYQLPMIIVDVDYQFDRHKLTIFYTAEFRIDFREFVRDLFSAFKTRIWMKKLNPAKPPQLKQWAAVGLATGMQFAGDRRNDNR